MSLLLIALAFSCTDYDLHKTDDGSGGDTGMLEDACETEDVPAESIAFDEACELDPEIGQFIPEIEWQITSFDEYPTSAYIMATTAVGHVTDDDGDGVYGSSGDVPDIAVVTYGSQNVLRLISGDGSGVHWSTTQGNPQGQGSVAIGDVDADGDPEIVSATETGRIVAYHHDGTLAWQSAPLQLGTWGSTGDIDQYCTNPAISDMNGDGIPEVIAGRAILNGSNGQILGKGNLGIGKPTHAAGVGTTSFAVDIDLDGIEEVITGNALYGPNGQTLSFSGGEDGYVAVANFDSDPEGEIVVVRDGTVDLFNHNWTHIWGPSSILSSWGGPPTIADFDGDGLPEIGVAGVSVYTVIDNDGTLLWSRTTQDATSGVTGSSVFDFEGDGIAEVVYADEVTLWVFNGPDGAVKLQSADHASNTWLEYPTVVDVDGDGHAEIVLGHNPYQGGKTAQGVTVFADSADTWSLTRPVWNQHAFHVTNVETDSTIPATADTNWATYNTFRSNDLHAGQGSLAANLVPQILGICEDECDQYTAYVWGRIRNQGAAEVQAGVTMAVIAGGAILDTTTVEAIPAGETSEGHLFRLDSDDIAQGFKLVADPADTISECDESDNEDLWTDAVCP